MTCAERKQKKKEKSAHLLIHSLVDTFLHCGGLVVLCLPQYQIFNSFWTSSFQWRTCCSNKLIASKICGFKYFSSDDKGMNQRDHTEFTTIFYLNKEPGFRNQNSFESYQGKNNLLHFDCSRFCVECFA